MLNGIQALRALAVFFVIFQHSVYTGIVYTGGVYKNEFPSFYPINYGRLGVVLFFSISGFVMALNRHKSVKEFLIHRMIRIYPSYWIAIFFAVCLLAYAKFNYTLTADAFLLIPSKGDSQIVIPYWTLIFEVIFYLILTLIYSLKLKDGALVALATLWILAINIAHQGAVNAYDFDHPDFMEMLLSPIMQVLPMGFLCGIFHENLKLNHKNLLLLVAIISYVCSRHFPDLTSQRHFFLGIATSVIVIYCSRVKFHNRAILIVGNSSYGMYLLHFPVLIFLVNFLLGLSPLLMVTILFCLSFGISFLFGLFDISLYRYFKNNLLSS